MQCRDFRELADSYLSDELLIETNHDLLRHLDTCPDCHSELTARRGLRHKLRDGFQHAPELQMSDDFGSRLKAELREGALRQPGSKSARRAAYIAVAATLVIAATLGFRIVQQRWRSPGPPSAVSGPNSENQNSRKEPVAPTGFLSAARTEKVIGDHRDCALRHRLEEKPIDLDEAGRKYDRAYINLVSAMTSEGTLPAGVELVVAHSCVFKGQRFGHVILKYHDQLISVLLTNAEALDEVPSTRADELIARSQFDGFRVAHFETGRHAVYVVSALKDIENLAIARAIEPSLSKHIREAERIA